MVPNAQITSLDSRRRAAPARHGALDTLLTDREHEVLRLIADGLSNRAIALRLTISEKTVECYVNRLFSKMQLEPDNTVHRRVMATIIYLTCAEPQPHRVRGA
ncbi:helix-turn-helix domain-containing protein [Pseudonocardia sp. TRM90224]|uniref:helix-turn-helix domain-containing protein n=1 Tax=Pseudonocardia sp. TRM90224 TaxID=2812678 RepID=UPI001E2A3F42|nr:helix-turn-helix transcriptional regulator [Pseudonocardia sp. TRM90224]